MQQLKVRQGLAGAIGFSVFLIIYSTIRSDEPVRTFLTLTVGLSVVIGGMALILRRLTRAKNADG